MKGIIDRFEGQMVVIEVEGMTRDYPRHEMAEDGKPGDVVEWVDGKWTVKTEETEDRRKRIEDKMNSLWAD